LEQDRHGEAELTSFETDSGPHVLDPAGVERDPVRRRTQSLERPQLVCVGLDVRGVSRELAGGVLRRRSGLERSSSRSVRQVRLRRPW